MLLATAALTLTPSASSRRGLNLPRTAYDTNQGNFRPGVFEYDYDAAAISAIQGWCPRPPSRPGGG